MSTLQQVMWKYEGCLVTDQPNLERMLADGSVVVGKRHSYNTRYSKPVTPSGVSELARREKGGRFLALLYMGLAPTEQMRGTIVTPCLQDIHTALGSDSFVTVHMRIEDEWKAHCEVKRQRVIFRRTASQCFVEPEKIVNRVIAVDEISSKYKRALMLFAENNLNSPQSVEAYGRTSDPWEPWPDDWVVTTPMRLPCFSESRLTSLGLTFTQQSAANFFVSVEATKGNPFIGHSMSTQTLAMQVVRGQRGDDTSNYWFNCRSSPNKAKRAPPIMQTHLEMMTDNHLFEIEPEKYCCPSTIPIEVC